MKRFFAVVPLAAAFSLGIMLTTSCSKSSDGGAGGGVTLNIPNMTATVSGTTAAAMSEVKRSYASESMQQQSGMLFTGTAPSNALVSSVFGMVKSFVTNAKTADSFSCMIEVLANNGLIKTDGTAAIFSDDQSSEFKAKFIIKSSGSTLQNFKMYTCNASGISNELYVEGGMSGNNMSYTMKFDFGTTLKGFMAVDGNWNGMNWSTKSLTMETSIGSGGSIVSKFLINQSTDNMFFKGTLNTGSSATTFQIYSKFALLGNSPATYAMGAGSMKHSGNSVTDAIGHWDATGTSAGTSTYATDVSAATYFPTNIAFTGDMTSGQTWDCQVGSASEVKVSTLNSATIKAIQSCMENQQ